MCACVCVCTCLCLCLCASVVGQYYATYLTGYYLNRLREEANRVDPHLDDFLRKQLQGFVETLRLLDPSNLGLARLEVRSALAPFLDCRGRVCSSAPGRALSSVLAFSLFKDACVGACAFARACACACFYFCFCFCVCVC
jgi:hypothetical protein